MVDTPSTDRALMLSYEAFELDPACPHVRIFYDPVPQKAFVYVSGSLEKAFALEDIDSISDLESVAYSMAKGVSNCNCQF